MTIPRTFTLFSQPITVTHDPTIFAASDSLGESSYRTNTIALTPSSPTYPIPQARLESVFLHELVHFILYYMKSDLFSDEKFVDQFALLLHQYETTRKGELHGKP